MRTRSTPRAVAVRLAASEPGRPVLLSRFSLTVTPSRLDEVWHAARLVRTHPSRRRSPRRPPSLSRNRLTGRHIRTKTLTTTTPRERPTSHGKCTHHLTLTPALLPAPSILLPLTDGDIPRSRVHAAPEGDILRVRGQDSGPRRRRTPPTAQKCPRRRRTSPLGASGPMGRRIPTGPATSAATPPGPAPSCADTGNRPDITTFTIRRTPTADTDNFLHYTSRRRTTQIEPRRRSTPTTRRAPPTP